MKNFNYINRESVNPIELNVLAKTYNTLEQGHQEAVKTASNLEVAMASLDLNEAESQWRQNKLAEIRQVVTDNTTYGNAYGALDDIVTKAGNIASDQGMIGRLQAQKDYKAYQANLDSAKIPEAYKDMFREQNTYNYADKVDEKTGQIIGGTKWTPSTRPVDSVDHFAVMTRALSIAAKESGSGSSVTFLDANGNPTRDASKSATGEMHMKTSTGYQRLSADKIKMAIDSAMASTPGAKESLEQDYKYTTWKHDKDVKANGDKPIVQDGVTDERGNILKFDDFVNKKVTPFINAAKYNNYSSDVQVGTALQSHRAKQAADANVANTIPANEILKNLSTAVTVGKLETEVDNYSTSVNNRNNANKNAIDIIEKLGGTNIKDVSSFIASQRGNNKTFGPGLAAISFIKQQEAKGIKISPEDKSALMTAVKSYVSYGVEQKKIENALSPEDRKALRFGTSVSNGEFTAGRSKWDDAIINANNTLWKENDKVDINITPNLLKNLTKEFGVGRLEELGLNTSTDEDGNSIVSFTANDRNMLPKFMSTIKKADDDLGMTWKALGNALTKRSYSDYTISTIPSKNANKFGYNDARAKTNINSLANTYDDGIDKASKVQQKAGVQRGILSIEGTAKNSFRQLELDHLYNSGQMNVTDYNAKSKMAEEDLNAMFAGGDFNAGMLYEADASNNFTKKGDVNETAALISYMYQYHPKNIIRNAIIPSGVVDTKRGGSLPMKGYVLNFTVPAEAKEGALKAFAGRSMKVMYGGGMKEGISSDPALAGGNVVTNIYNTSKATNTPATILPYSNALGSTDVTFNKGNVNINFLGSTIPSNREAAVEYMKNIHTLDGIKDIVNSRSIVDPNKFAQGLTTVVNNLSNITGKDPKLVETAVLNYLKEQ